MDPSLRQRFLARIDRLPVWWVVMGLIVGYGGALGIYSPVDVREGYLRVGGAIIAVVMSALGARLAYTWWRRRSPPN